MSEIKFRAWDHGTNDWHDFNENDFKFSPTPPLNVLLMRSMDGMCQLEQFTGLLDKNGKEIYEGDVIICGNGQLSEIKYGEFDYTCECIDGDEMSAIGFYFYPQMDPFASPYLGATFKGYEVVGNIHTNPELLETP